MKLTIEKTSTKKTSTSSAFKSESSAASENYLFEAMQDAFEREYKQRPFQNHFKAYLTELLNRNGRSKINMMFNPKVSLFNVACLYGFLDTLGEHEEDRASFVTATKLALPGVDESQLHVLAEALGFS